MNAEIAKALRAADDTLQLYVPQENDAINDKEAYANSAQIAQADLAALRDSDLLVAVIDGVEIDSGVAAEIGAFSMLGRPIVALCSDVRQQGTSNKQKIEALQQDALENQFIYRNLFVVGLIKENGVIVSTIEDIVREVLARR